MRLREFCEGERVGFGFETIFSGGDGGRPEAFRSDSKVVAIEVDDQESGHRAFCVFGDINQEARFRCLLFAGEGNQHLTADGFSAKCVVVVLDDLEFHSGRTSMGMAVNVLSK